MNAIVTVVGRDRVGITASVCTLLAENNINILDISQTIPWMWASPRHRLGSCGSCWRSWGTAWRFPSGFSGRRSLTPCTASDGEPTAPGQIR